MLDVRDLCVDLALPQGRVHALRHVSFQVNPGETFALVGESGCGKSLTALSLMRLLPEVARVTAGEILFHNENLLALPESQMQKRRARRISMVFQEPSTSLNPVLTVGEQVAEVLRLHSKLSPAAIEKETQLWLARVGIPRPAEYAKAYPHELSGGQKQRVMIAMALAARPEIVIADEPTTALDVTLQAQILDLLKRLRTQRQIGLILITHDLAVVQECADRVALMYGGEIVESATTRDFFSRPLHPYAKELLLAVPSAVKSDRALRGIAAPVPALSAQDPVGCLFAAACPAAKADCRCGPLPLRTVGPGHWLRCRHPQDYRVSTEHLELFSKVIKEPVLTVSHVDVSYEKPRGILRPSAWIPVVQDASFVLRAGETLALVGESGSGKTTLALACLGLLGDRARVKGSVRLMDTEVVGAKEGNMREVRRMAQIIFQDPFASLDPRLTVEQSIAEGLLSLARMSGKERHRRVVDLLRAVGLTEDAAERLPHEFSGGQRQRIAIARALAINPKVIICDEPTSALDVSVQAQILNLMRSLQRERGVSYLFITHNFAVVEYIADRVAVMQKGKIVEQGLAKEVLSRPKTAYARELLRAVPRLRLS